MKLQQETTGRWWTVDGWQVAICRHDSHVLGLETTSPDASLPMFIPAPVDLHVHGGGGHDCMSGDEAIRGMLLTHARHGTGALLATSVTAPFENTSRFLESVTRVMHDPQPGEATLLGAHLEGPFISPDKLGAQPPFSAALNLDQLEVWFDTGVVRVITYAPELDLDGNLITLCDRYKVRAQIGHTLCSWAQAQKALQRGCGMTHLYNAMSGVNHRRGGAATAALAYAEFAEIITDGLHVDQAAFDAARRAIPGLYSITDATAATAMPDGEYQLGSLLVNKTGERVLLPDGTIAGSCLTQRRSLSVLRDWGLDWHAIGSFVSAIPARWITNDALGNIAPGAYAHWIEIYNDEPVALWLAGERLAW
jgi:N-acetylglucosamine-6-phosphate deacetylase